VALLQQLIQDAWQNAAFEGISMDCLGLASVQATTSGVIEVNGEKIPALRGNRLSDGAPLTVYPGEVPSRLPGQAFWDSQGFQSITLCRSAKPILAASVCMMSSTPSAHSSFTTPQRSQINMAEL
ncbi:YcjX family protein, partial [Salmonella enterica subsp. enterica serovar Anatum]|nr:YcjX family protein [Salmonella enterica subsp. enterica serovar Anatum]